MMKMRRWNTPEDWALPTHRCGLSIATRCTMPITTTSMPDSIAPTPAPTAYGTIVENVRKGHKDIFLHERWVLQAEETSVRFEEALLDVTWHVNRVNRIGRWVAETNAPSRV